jgi:hypothetical protein
MTYQEKYEELQKDLNEKAAKFRDLEEKVLQVKGFGDHIELMAFLKAQHAHLVATNAYTTFLERFHGKGIDPHSEYKG